MRGILSCVLLFSLSACMPGAAFVELSPSQAAPTVINPAPEQPTAEPLPNPTRTPQPLSFSPDDPDNVILDFTADLCAAEWSNSGEYLECPGNQADTSSGFAGILLGATLQDETRIQTPSVLMIPPHGSRFGGIFGAYPEITIYPGDHFKAVLACEQNSPGCDISYALHYYNAAGDFRDISAYTGPHPMADHTPSDNSYTAVDIDLTDLAGQTVRFVLTIRTEGEPLAYRALWIGPHIQRMEGAQPAPNPAPVFIETPAPDEESQVPGVIKGWVDLSSAPPYLNDPGTGQSSPVAVMFFNLDDGTWWWIHSTATHPYYQMTVPPGDYHVVAYGPGVAGSAYVTGGYTGSNPSCGQALKVVHVPAETTVDNIIIADWNWTCGGTAYRPEKPEPVPLP